MLGNNIENIKITSKEYFEEIEKAEKFHGHLCQGMIIGVKMALTAKYVMGCEKFPDKDLIVTTEIDRCLTDAIMSVTGCRLGRKTLKFKDYGKFAATFYSIKRDKAVRIVVKPRNEMNFEEKLEKLKIDMHDMKALSQFHFEVPPAAQFNFSEAEVHFSENQLPGKPKVIVQCSNCHENVMDAKHEVLDEKIYCHSCFEKVF